MSGCARCAITKADLAAVSAVLSRTHLPPMPEALAQRVQMAIASESAARSAAAGSAAQATTRTERAGAAQAITDTEKAGAAGAGATGAGAGRAGDATAPDDADDAVFIPGRPDLPDRSKHARAPRRFRLPSLSSPLVLRGL